MIKQHNESKEAKERMRIKMKEVSEKTGVSYSSIRHYVRKFEKELIARGVLEVEQGFVRKRYYVLVEPDEFVDLLKDLIGIRGSDE